MRYIIEETIQTILIALLLFIAVEVTIQNFRVEGSSMDPTLESGQYLIVNKIIYASFELNDVAPYVPFVHASDGAADRTLFAFHSPVHGEVAIFHYPHNPDRDFVKRVIGLPGDTVEIKRGDVYRNGILVEEPYVTQNSSRSYDPVTVTSGHYYVLGDNRRASNDSRDWGLVPAEHLVGRAMFGYWPPQNFGIID